jgi:hypothetical protein
MQTLIIKEEHFNNILKALEDNDLYFITDGCACGYIDIELNDNLYLHIYRTCRRSGNTPDKKLWQIHEFAFYDRAYGEDTEALEEDGEIKKLDFKLNENQSKLLIEKLKKITLDIWGYEYRSEY